MVILTVDTSTPAVTAGVVALDDDVRVLAERVTFNARAHAELLTPHLLESLAASGKTFADVDAVVCGAGPGPFTGLRAGLVTAAALAHALDVPAYPVCSLDAIAAEAGTGSPLLVVTDARRREVYWARYDSEGARVDGPSVTKPSDVDTKATERVAGQGVSAYPEAFSLTVVDVPYPTVRGLALAAADAIRAGADPEPLTPLYLRRPDAKEPAERKRVTV